MDAEVVRQTAEHAGIFALAIGFLAGLVFGFNPVALASIPVSLAYVTKARAPREAIFFGIAFTVGMIVVQVLLGFAAVPSNSADYGLRRFCAGYGLLNRSMPGV